MSNEPDDNIRGDLGLLVSLRELNNGKLRITIDDVERPKQHTWKRTNFVTHKDYEEMDLRKVDFPESELADFGLFVLLRLLSTNGKTI